MSGRITTLSRSINDLILMLTDPNYLIKIEAARELCLLPNVDDLVYCKLLDLHTDEMHLVRMQSIRAIYKYKIINQYSVDVLERLSLDDYECVRLYSRDTKQRLGLDK